MNEYPGLWRDGNLLVFHQSARFPPRCIKCNELTTGKMWNRNFYWHPSWVYLLFLLHVLVYIVVAMVMRKSARAQVGLCEAHRSRRRNAILIGWAGLLGGIALAVYAGVQEWGAVAGLAILGALVAVIYGVAVAPLVRPTKIENGYVYLRGVSPDFLALLPGVGAPQGSGGQVAPDVVRTFD